MGRRKKNSKNFRNFGLGIFAAIIVISGYLCFINGNYNLPDITFFDKFKNSMRVQEPVLPEDTSQNTFTADNTPVHKVKIFFLINSNGKDLYRTVTRENKSNKSDIEYALSCLLKGPTKYEQQKGIYSEIPATKLISVKEMSDKITINISDSFASGGGADSIYKRMFQLIKTVNINTEKPAYLYINGNLAETIGGEGLMLKQPLNGSSLDD